MYTRRILFACTLFALSFVMCSTLLRAPSSAGLSLNKGVVNAGSKLELTVSVDPAPSYSGTIQAIFYSEPSGQDNTQVGFSGPLLAGQTKATLVTDIPIDAIGGNYKCQMVRFVISRIYTLQFSPITFEVISIENIVHPTIATLALNLNQKQFLQTQANTLHQLQSDLQAKLSVNAADTPSLRKTLASTVGTADELLIRDQHKYEELAGKNLNPKPIFFEDFHRNYLALLVDLRAPIAEKDFSQHQNGKVIDVQLRTRRSNDKDANKLEGSYPPVATAVLTWLTRNITAYLLIEKTGVDTFPLSLKSRPPGASISFTRTGEPYKDYSRPTDVLNIRFPIAMWTFKFVKAGCEPEFFHPDPYLEADPDGIVEFNRCKTK